MFDSSIRLKQINTGELASFILGLINSPSGTIIPSGSGIYNLGSISDPYQNIYSEELNLVSGINFGNTSFTAYISNGAGVINVGGYLITSSGIDEGNYISIQGPSGSSGFARNSRPLW